MDWSKLTNLLGLGIYDNALSGNELLDNISDIHCYDSRLAAGSIDAIQWPASLKRLELNNNPDLHGTVTKKLVLQCSKGITFSGCKPKYGAGGKMNEEFLSFPYLVWA